MSHAPDDLLTVNEAAQILRVSATTVRNWAADGRLETSRTVGGHRRFRAADVQRLARQVVPRSRPVLLVIDDDEAIRFVLREAFSTCAALWATAAFAEATCARSCSTCAS